MTTIDKTETAREWIRRDMIAHPDAYGIVPTTKLNSGAVVLAHDSNHRYAGDAITYCNPSQAKARLAKLQAQGVVAKLRGIRPIYIEIL